MRAMNQGSRIALVAGFMSVIALSGCAGDPQKAKAAYLESGKRYVNQGKYPEAAIQFRNALKIDPRYADAYYELGKDNLAMKQWHDAYSSLAQAAQLDPNRTDVQLALAEMYLAGPDFKKAEDTASNILQKEPSNPRAIQILGAALLGEQNYDGAEKAFAKATELLPGDPSALTSLAMVELTEHKFGEAEQHLSKAIEAGPQFPLSYQNLGTLYRLQNQYAKSEAVLQRGITNNPTSIPLYISLMDVLELEGQHEHAQATLKMLRDTKESSAAIASAIGDWYTSHGDLNDARVEYRRGLDQNPKDTDLKLKVIETDLNTINLTEASSLNDQILAEHPKNLIANINRGRLLAAEGRPEEAASELMAQIKDSPDSPEAHYYLALVHLATNHAEQAKNELANTLKLAPNSVLAKRALAEIYFAQGDLVLAQETLQRNLNSASPDIVDLTLMGNILLRRGDSVRAREEFRFAQRLSPNNSFISLSLAAVDESEKKWSDADTEFRNAIRLSPNDVATLGKYADFLARRGQSEKAVHLLQQFASAKPQNGPAHLGLANFFVNSKNYSEAKAEAQLALEFDPRLIQGYLLLAKIDRDQGNIDEAIQNCAKAKSLQPKSSPILTLLGNLYIMKKNYPAARTYFEQALAADPNAAIAASNLAWIATQEGSNLDVALSLAQKAKQLMPQVDSITDTLGWVEYKKGSYSSSIPLFQECVQSSPEVASYHFHLGLALLASGETVKAKSQLQSALRLKLADDDAEQARQTLARLN